MSEEGSSTRSYRFPDRLLKSAEDEMKQRNIKSFNELLTTSLEHYLKCHATEEANMMKLIILRYKAKCLKCGREINAGDYAIYGRGVGAICLDCHIERVGDKTAIAKYLRNRELDKVYHALKRECESLAERVEVFRTVDKFESIVKAQKDVNDLIEKYLKSGLASPEEQNLLLELKERKKALEILEEEVRKFMEKYLKDVRWLKKKPRTEEEEERQYA